MAFTLVAFEAFINGLGLRHFRPAELLVNAARPNNTPPPPELWPNIAPTLYVLDELRQALGEPITINSAYRSKAYNRSIGGSANSQHVLFTALDFAVRNVTPLAVGRTLREWRACRPWIEKALPAERAGRAGFPFAALQTRNPTAFRFEGGVGIYNTFVHLDTRGVRADWGAATAEPVCTQPPAGDAADARGVVDRDAFFGKFTAAFGRAPSTPQREGFHAIFQAWEAAPYTDVRWLAYILATAWHETGSRLQPVREGFATTDEGAIAAVTRLFDRGKIRRNYALPEPNGKSYFGRGLVQLTHGHNYLRVGQALGMGNALYDDPSLALRPDLSARILVEGMGRGLYTNGAHKLPDYFSSNRADWVNARKIVNGLDRATAIAEYGRKFRACL